MTIGGINGKVRQGKGILLSLFGLADIESGKKVYANFPLRGSVQIDAYEFVSLMRKERNLENVTLCIQEIYGWLNSHKSMSNVSELEDVFVFQSGKLGYDIYYDTQVQMRALASLRDMTDWRFGAEKFGDTVRDFESGYFEYKPLSLKFDEENLPIGDGFRIPFKVASLWWDQFDTYARSLPIGFENLLASMAKVDPKITIEFVKKQVALLLDHRELWVKPDRVSVECALLELGESASFASLVANRLQLSLSAKPQLSQKREIPPLVRSDPRLSRWR